MESSLFTYAFARLEAGGTKCRPLECVEFVLPDFNPHKQRLVGSSVGEGDYDLAAAVCGGGKLFHQGRILPDGCEDVEVTQHGRAVDGNIEDTTSLRAEIGLREVKQDGVLSSGRQARNRVGKDPRSPMLIHSHGCGVGPRLG